MHLPRITNSNIGVNRFGTLKRICATPKTIIKKTYPAIMIAAHALTAPIASHAPERMPVETNIQKQAVKSMENIFGDIIETVEFQRIKKMVANVVPDVKDEFVSEIIKTSEKVNCEAEDLTALLYKESKFEPDVKNGSFAGLGQLGKDAIKLSSEISMEKFLSLSRAEQMPYVRNYILTMKNTYMRKHKGKLTGGELYALFYTPARVNKPFLTSATDSITKTLYEANKPLDYDKDLKITKTDLQMVLNNIKTTILNPVMAKK